MLQKNNELLEQSLKGTS